MLLVCGPHIVNDCNTGNTGVGAERDEGKYWILTSGMRERKPVFGDWGAHRARGIEIPRLIFDPEFLFLKCLKQFMNELITLPLMKIYYLRYSQGTVVYLTAKCVTKYFLTNIRFNQFTTHFKELHNHSHLSACVECSKEPYQNLIWIQCLSKSGLNNFSVDKGQLPFHFCMCCYLKALPLSLKR